MVSKSEVTARTIDRIDPLLFAQHRWESILPSYILQYHTQSHSFNLSTAQSSPSPTTPNVRYNPFVSSFLDARTTRSPLVIPLALTDQRILCRPHRPPFNRLSDDSTWSTPYSVFTTRLSGNDQVPPRHHHSNHLTSSFDQSRLHTLFSTHHRDKVVDLEDRLLSTLCYIHLHRLKETEA